MGIFAGYLLLSLLSACSYVYIRRKKIPWKYVRYLPMISLLSMLCLIVGIWEQTHGEQGSDIYQLQRNEAGQGERTEQLYLYAENLLEAYSYDIEVQERLLKETEAKEVLEKAQLELEQVIMGENSSLDEIDTDITIPKTLQNGQVTVNCTFEPYEWIEADGTVLWNQLEENTLIKVVAQLECQELKADHEFFIQLVPRELEKEQEILAGIEKHLAAANPQEAYLELPREMEGVTLHWSKEEVGLHVKLLVLGITVIVAWYVYEKEKEEQQQKRKARMLKLDYPDIVSRLSLLSGAGMTMSTAWAKLAKEYQENRKKGITEMRPGYEEMLKAWYEMQDGISEIKAYENFGNRCNQPQYRKFASILMQNVRKGTKGLQQLLDAEAAEAFLERKAYARQIGEETGTRLLLPMGIMLVLVFVILLMPAMLTLNI